MCRMETCCSCCWYFSWLFLVFHFHFETTHAHTTFARTRARTHTHTHTHDPSLKRHIRNISHTDIFQTRRTIRIHAAVRHTPHHDVCAVPFFLASSSSYHHFNFGFNFSSSDLFFGHNFSVSDVRKEFHMNRYIQNVFDKYIFYMLRTANAKNSWRKSNCEFWSTSIAIVRYLGDLQIHDIPQHTVLIWTHVTIYHSWIKQQPQEKISFISINTQHQIDGPGDEMSRKKKINKNQKCEEKKNPNDTSNDPFFSLHRTQRMEFHRFKMTQKKKHWFEQKKKKIIFIRHPLLCLLLWCRRSA